MIISNLHLDNKPVLFQSKCLLTGALRFLISCLIKSPTAKSTPEETVFV